jgi:hypothetical protein
MIYGLGWVVNSAVKWMHSDCLLGMAAGHRVARGVGVGAAATG